MSGSASASWPARKAADRCTLSSMPHEPSSFYPREERKAWTVLTTPLRALMIPRPMIGASPAGFGLRRQRRSRRAQPGGGSHRPWAMASPGGPDEVYDVRTAAWFAA